MTHEVTKPIISLSFFSTVFSTIRKFPKNNEDYKYYFIDQYNLRNSGEMYGSRAEPEVIQGCDLKGAKETCQI